MTTIRPILQRSFQAFFRHGLFIAVLALSAQGARSQNCAAWETYPNFQTNAVYSVFEYEGVLYRGGWFSLFRWDGTEWQEFGGGIGGDSGTLFAADMKMYGGVLVIGGHFPTAGGRIVNSIATWDGVAFGPLGAGIYGDVEALGAYNGDLIAGGQFTYAGGTPARNIARWDGSAWYPLGAGVYDAIPDGTGDGVWDMVVWEGDLYVVGDFTHAGGVEVSYLARWDGSTWSDVAGGVSLAGGGPTGLRGVDVYNGDLVIVGCLDYAGATEAINIARWDGVVWSPVGSGSDPTGEILGTELRKAALSVASYGGLLYVGADFTKAVNKNASGIAVWDGQRWKAVDQGVGESEGWPIAEPTIRDLEVCGGSLLMGGNFDSANHDPTDNVARYTDCSAPTGVAIDNNPKLLRIVSVSPNPFNPSTTVHFTLPEAMPVTAEIWSATGTRVRTLANQKPFGTGDNQLTWDGMTDRGSRAASGVYFIRLRTRLGADITRAVLLK